MSDAVRDFPALLLVGLVRKPHGLSGELSIAPVTDFPERFAPGVELTWRQGAQTRILEITHARPHGDRVLLTFSGIADVDSARQLIGGELLVGEENAVPAPAGFYYSHEIDGFRCEDRQGRPLGFARGVAETPAGPLLTVATEAGKEALVPFVDEMIVAIDRDSRTIVLDLPEGLLEL